MCHPDVHVQTVSWIAPGESYDELPSKYLLNNK